MQHSDLTEIRKKYPVMVNELIKNWPLFVMLLPGLFLVLLLNYLPMAGVLISFKNFTFHGKSFFENFSQSKWVGFENFRFFLGMTDSFTITRNTILYNLAFIIAGTLISVFCALALNELKSRRMAKFYQSSMLLPYFLSWVVISYLFFGFLSEDKGIINNSIFRVLGLSPIAWYAQPNFWPFILVLANVLKYSGYNCIVYLAAITGIDPEYFEVAALDGASKWQQMTRITLPLLSPVITMMILIAIGRIFFADFGLFYQVPMNSGVLFNVTNVIDTYVYRGLMKNADMGMASAAGTFQALVGFVFVLGSNLIVRKFDREKALF